MERKVAIVTGGSRGIGLETLPHSDPKVKEHPPP